MNKCIIGIPYSKKVKVFLKWRDKPDFNHVAPNSCMLNIVLSLDTKGVSNIYKMIVGNNRSIVEKACDKWNEKLTTKIETFSVR